MKKFLAILTVLCLFSSLAGCGEVRTSEAAKLEREFTDSLGRTVMLPEKIEKLAMSGPLTQIYVFPLCPELLAGFSTAFSQDSGEIHPRGIPQASRAGTALRRQGHYEPGGPAGGLAGRCG